MRVKYSNVFLNVNQPAKIDRSASNIFFLHGFTGSSGDWSGVVTEIDNRFNKFTIDLLGHGKSDFPNDPSLYSWELQVEQLNKIITNFTEDKVILNGYSMGGRLALCYAHTYPERVLGLILESASPGLRDKRQKEKRIREDEQLARIISSHQIDEFINLWVNKEIFSTQLRFSEEKRKEIKMSKMKNNPIGLSNSLLGFSTGRMPNLYPQLKKMNTKALLITGELDTKFTELNKSIAKKFPAAKHVIIKNAGHTVHLEEPAKFTAAVNDFLKGFINI
jgi:2-succinyl-6-hydroxy-2,4-cyclohexadiene-1-carboxylate synthase